MVTITKPGGLFLNNKISLYNEHSLKPGEAGARGWWPQDGAVSLARRFSLVFISNSAQINMRLCWSKIFCIPCLSLPSRRSRNLADL